MIEEYSKRQLLSFTIFLNHHSKPAIYSPPLSLTSSLGQGGAPGHIRGGSKLLPRAGQKKGGAELDFTERGFILCLLDGAKNKKNQLKAIGSSMKRIARRRIITPSRAGY